jgi:hypothetical protein
VRCKTCHYSLRNLTVRRCPECGGAFDPADPKTWESDALAAGHRRLSWIALVLLISLVLFMIAAFIPVITNYLL